MGTFAPPSSHTSRLLIGNREREVASIDEALGFIRECDGDDLAELLADQAFAAGMSGKAPVGALKARLEAFRSVLVEDGLRS